MTCSASIIVRCFNDAHVVGETLEAVFGQRRRGFRVVAIDSGSSDGSVDILRSFPLELIEIPLGSYVPGRVLNLGMSRGAEPWAVFVNSDCTPQHPEWLEELLAPLEEDPGTAAVYGRQLPRPEATPLVVKDYERAFGDGTEARRWRHFFSMASSAVRRSVWAEHPFDPDIRYSEDVHWTWRRRQEGWRIAYAASAVAMHSHNYTLAETRRRFHGEGRADAEIFPPDLLPASFVGGVVAPWAAEVVRDLRWCLGRGHLGEALVAPVTRWAQRSSYWGGLRAGLAAAGG